MLTWRADDFKALSCRDFPEHIDIANEQESRRDHLAKVNSAYYCEHVFADIRTRCQQHYTCGRRY